MNKTHAGADSTMPSTPMMSVGVTAGMGQNLYES